MHEPVNATLEPDLLAPARARRMFVSDFPEIDGRAREDALVVVSELVTNAVLHGTGCIRVRLALDERTFCIEVEDESPGIGPPSPDSRGLAVIAALSRSFGVRPAEHGKTVWAVLEV